MSRPLPDFRILGPLEVHSENGPLPLAGGKQRALLALLVLHPNEVVSSDRLIEKLWGAQPPETAAKALQGHVSALRKLLEPGRGTGEPNRVLVTCPPGYLLRLDPGQLDLTRFERLRAAARASRAAGDQAGARAVLAQALSLWRGQPLADLAYEPFARTAIARLEEVRRAAIEERIELDLIQAFGIDFDPGDTEAFNFQAFTPIQGSGSAGVDNADTQVTFTRR